MLRMFENAPTYANAALAAGLAEIYEELTLDRTPGPFRPR
jgi:hypothetical protein